MDERERMEHYLAWRKSKGKDRRGRFYRRLRVAGTGATLAVLVITLGAALAGWPRLAGRDIARPVAPASHFASRRELAGPEASAPVLTAAAPPALSAPEAVAPENGHGQSSPVTAAMPARRTASPRVAATPRALPLRQSTTRAELPPVARVTTEPAALSSEPSASMRPPAFADESAAPLTPATDSPAFTARVNESPAPSATLQPGAAGTPLPASGPPLPSGAVPSLNTSAVSPRNTTAVAPTVISLPAPTTRPPDERIERLKHLAGYIPEVWIARHVARWVKQHQADEPGAAPLQGSEPQSR